MENSRWYRWALSCLLLVAVLWLWANRFDELKYHTLGSSDLIEIGDALSFDDKRDTIKPNSYVSVEGVLGNKAATLKGLRAGSFRLGPYQVRHLLGSKIYIEYDQEKYHKKFGPFTRVSVKGRLVPFGPGSELERVRMFFKEYYKKEVSDNAMIVVVDETPQSEHRYAILFLLSFGILLASFYSSYRAVKQKV